MSTVQGWGRAAQAVIDENLPTIFQAMDDAQASETLSGDRADDAGVAADLAGQYANAAAAA